MSRIGEKSINLPDNTTVSITDDQVVVKGTKGELIQLVPKGIKISQEDGLLSIKRLNNQKQTKANHGLIRSLLNNMVEGVNQGFSKKLELVGTGYRAKKQGNNLILNVGFSKPVEYPVPEDIAIDLEGETIVAVTGIDKQKVGHTAAEIRKIRKPEPYKGKGIRYQDEIIRKKAGKANKVGAAA